MTRADLRARIRSEVEQQGYAAVPTGDVWAAFTAPGEDDSLPFDDALCGFAAVNGWQVRRDDRTPADTSYVFYPTGPEPALNVTSQGS